DVVGDVLFLRRLARTFVDQRDVEVLLLEVSEDLGELVRNVDLLVEPADHDLHVGRRVVLRRWCGCAAPARGEDEHPGQDEQQRTDEYEHTHPPKSVLSWR